MTLLKYIEKIIRFIKQEMHESIRIVVITESFNGILPDVLITNELASLTFCGSDYVLTCQNIHFTLE